MSNNPESLVAAREDGGGTMRSPTDAEDRAMLSAMLRHRERVSPPAVAIQQELGATEIGCPHDDRDGHGIQVADAFGTRSGDFSHACIGWLANAAAERGKPLSQTTVNASLAVVAAAAPANEVEALLAVQLYATHDLSMEMMRRTKQANDVRAMTEFGTLATKLSRTMTAQIEALSKLRRGGEQTVRVEHVHVYEGGQAVVGVVNTQGGKGADGKRGRQSYGPDVAAAIGPALLGEDAAGNGVPIAGHARAESVPHPRRRKPRRAERQP